MTFEETFEKESIPPPIPYAEFLQDSVKVQVGSMVCLTWLPPKDNKINTMYSENQIKQDRSYFMKQNADFQP